MTRFIEKPWGAEFIGQRVGKCAFKTLRVLRGKRLSLQRHKRKSEVWLVVEGEPWVDCGEFHGRAKPGQFFFIDPNTVHRLSADNGNVVVWEMQCGEDTDIERLEDDYGRDKDQNKS